VNVADFIKEHCSTFGTGTLNLTGAVDLSVGSFREAWDFSTEVHYSILDGANRESGIGTFNGTQNITRDTIISTIENDVYNNINPSPIDLQGSAIVACTMSAKAFYDLSSAAQQNSIDILWLSESLSIHTTQSSAHSASAILYNSNNDDTTNADNVQEAMESHSTAIESNTATIGELDDDLVYRESAITALEFGGLITQYNPTTIIVAAGKGEIIDSYSDTEHQETREITWPELTVNIKDTLNGMPIPTGVGSTDIAIHYNGLEDPTVNGSVIVFPSGMDASQRRKNIKLGFIEYFDRIITSVNNEPIISNQIGNTLLDYIYFIDWTSKMNGLVLRPTSKTVPDRTLWRDEGLIFGPGVNHANALDNPNVVNIVANGSELINFDFIPTAYNEGVTEYTSPIPLVPNTVYESNGVGGVAGLTNVSQNKVVVHYVFESLGGTMYLNYGQKEYDSFDIAVANLYADRASHYVPAELASFILLGQVVILDGATTFGVGSIEVFPINSTISSGSTGSTVAQATNISYTDAYGLSASNVQTAIDTLANVRLTAAQHDAIKASHLPSTANPYLTQSGAGVTYAPLIDPVLLGNPKAPTQSIGSNSTLIATTAFVQNELSNRPGKNLLINGDFSVWERGDSFTINAGSATMIADRVQCWTAGSSLFPYKDPGGLVFQGQIGNTAVAFNMRIEADISRHLIDKESILSIHVDVDSTISGVVIHVYYANALNDFSGITSVATNTLSLSAGKSILSLSVPADTNFSNGLQVSLGFNDGVTAGYVTLENMQLELGNKVTEPEIVNPTDQLARCKRYYERIAKDSSDTDLILGIGSCVNTTLVELPIRYTEKRIKPDVVVNDITDISIRIPGGGSVAATLCSLKNANTTMGTLTLTSSGLVGGNACDVKISNISNYVEIDADLW